MSLLILDRSGHQTLTVDMSSAEAIGEAEQLIRSHQAKGSAVFVDGELLAKDSPLNPTATETIITPALQGG
jgi:hypothetical protein